MSNQIDIRRYNDEDRYQIINLLNRNFEKQQYLKINRDIEWWEWKYEKNIFGKPIIYVAELNNRIIGVRPFWPWQLSMRDKKLTCFQPVDAVIEEEFRRQGLFTKLTKKFLFDNAENTDLVFNFSNKQSISGSLKLGWIFVDNLRWYVKINNIISIYRLARNHKGFSSIKLNMKDAISKQKINQLKLNFNFNEKLKLKTLRIKQFLIWRYLNHPKINYGLNLIEENGKQLAYIFEINENEYGKELIVLDYFGELGLFSNMLSEIKQMVKKNKITMTLIISNYNTPIKLLQRDFYIKQKTKNLLVLPLNIQIKKEAICYDDWEIFLGMHDSL